MKLRVNILLPSFRYTIMRNDTSVRHHLYDLYTKAFNLQNVSILPKKKVSSILAGAIKNWAQIESGTLNVVTQGYSVLAVYAATVFRRDIHIIVHTWKVPGYSDKKITAYLYDFFLGRLISKSLMVVVASKKQERQINTLFRSIPTFFAPVTIDPMFWRAAPNNNSILTKYGLKESGFLLTVGGNDRNEEISMRVAELLGIPFVRVTINQSVINHIKVLEKKLNISKETIILKNISDADLIALYNCAFVVLLPTITETNPAGLSSLVEAMSCEALIAVPNELSEGYVSDGETGIVFKNQNHDVIAGRLKGIDGEKRKYLKKKAREYAVNSLNSNVVAANLKKSLSLI